MIGVESGLLPGRTPGLLSREVRGTFGRKERGTSQLKAVNHRQGK